VEIKNSDILFFRVDGSVVENLPADKEKEQRNSKPLKGILCRACGKVVTSRDEKIVVGGSHAHTFFNPAGIVFELGCFRKAPGCRNSGRATSEFTWFAGYVWRFARCSNCGAHLGWFFEGRDSTFFGLILTKLQE
jgi:hypothetical protein